MAEYMLAASPVATTQSVGLSFAEFMSDLPLRQAQAQSGTFFSLSDRTIVQISVSAAIFAQYYQAFANMAYGGGSIQIPGSHYSVRPHFQFTDAEAPTFVVASSDLGYNGAFLDGAYVRIDTPFNVTVNGPVNASQLYQFYSQIRAIPLNAPLAILDSAANVISNSFDPNENYNHSSTLERISGLLELGQISSVTISGPAPQNVVFNSGTVSRYRDVFEVIQGGFNGVQAVTVARALELGVPSQYFSSFGIIDRPEAINDNIEKLNALVKNNIVSFLFPKSGFPYSNLPYTTITLPDGASRQDFGGFLEKIEDKLEYDPPLYTKYFSYYLKSADFSGIVGNKLGLSALFNENAKWDFVSPGGLSVNITDLAFRPAGSSFTYVLDSYLYSVISLRQDGNVVVSLKVNDIPQPYGPKNFYLASDPTGGSAVKFSPLIFSVAQQGADAFVTGGDFYAGAVDYLQRQFINSSGQPMNVSSAIPNVFLHGGGAVGGNALQVHSGQNVLDGGVGSNFLVGGAGTADTDTYFLDGRGGSVTWGTVVNFGAGDAVTFWGWQDAVTTFDWVAEDGADGYKGATIHASLAGNGKIDASITFAGVELSAAQNFIMLTNGLVDGNKYAYILGA